MQMSLLTTHTNTPTQLLNVNNYIELPDVNKTYHFQIPLVSIVIQIHGNYLLSLQMQKHSLIRE